MADALNVTDLPQARMRMSARWRLRAGQRRRHTADPADDVPRPQPRSRWPPTRSAPPRSASRRCCRCSATRCPADSPARRRSATSTPPALVRCSRRSPRAARPTAWSSTRRPRLLVGAAASPGTTGVEQPAGQDRRRRDVRPDADRARRRRLRGLAGDRARGRADRARGASSSASRSRAAPPSRERVAGFGALVAADVAARAERGRGPARGARDRRARASRCRASAGLHLMPLGAEPGALRELAARARAAASAA